MRSLFFGGFVVVQWVCSLYHLVNKKIQTRKDLFGLEWGHLFFWCSHRLFLCMHPLTVLIKYCVLLLLSSQVMVGQAHYRFSSDYSIKEIDTNGVQKVSFGRVYLDRQVHALNFEQRFPTHKVYSFSDHLLSVSTADTSFGVVVPKGLFQYTIYNIILSNQLSDYGLDDSKCKLIGVSQKEGKVVRAYEFLDQSHREMHLVKSHQDLIEVMVIFNEQGHLVSKSFFEEYQLVGGLMVPHRIVQFWYRPSGKVSKKISTLRDVILDEKSNHGHYAPGE